MKSLTYSQLATQGPLKIKFEKMENGREQKRVAASKIFFLRKWFIVFVSTKRNELNFQENFQALDHEWEIFHRLFVFLSYQSSWSDKFKANKRFPQFKKPKTQIRRKDFIAEVVEKRCRPFCFPPFIEFAKRWNKQS